MLISVMARLKLPVAPSASSVRAAVTEFRGLGGYEQQEFISRSPGGRESRVCPHGRVLVRACPQTESFLLFAESSHGGRGEGALWGLFYKTLLPLPNSAPL